MKITYLLLVGLLAFASFQCTDAVKNQPTTDQTNSSKAQKVNLTSNAESKAVERACMDYLEGFYEGDTLKIHKSLHPTLYKFGYWKNKDSKQYEADGHMTYQQAINYAQRVKEKGEFPHKNSIKKTEILDISNHTAAAKVTAWWGTDYMLLAKHNGKWMIEQVLWEGPLEKDKK